MHNVLKMDLFRMIRSKSFYITIFISVAMAAFVLWAMDITSEVTASNSADGTVTVESSETLTSVDQCIDGIFNGNYVVLFVVIFTIIFCNAERKNGYIKNIASIVTQKYKMIASKFIIMTIYVIAIYAALTATIFVACNCFMGISQIDSAVNIVKMIGTGLLMNISIGSLVIMFFTLVEKSMVVMPASIVYVLMGSTIFQVIYLFTDRVLKLDSFDAFEYTNLGNMNYISIDSGCNSYIRAVIVAVVLFVIGYVVSVLTIDRKDIN